jgi:hypothetical protein
MEIGKFKLFSKKVTLVFLGILFLVFYFTRPDEDKFFKEVKIKINGKELNEEARFELKRILDEKLIPHNYSDLLFISRFNIETSYLSIKSIGILGLVFIYDLKIDEKGHFLHDEITGWKKLDELFKDILTQNIVKNKTDFDFDDIDYFEKNSNSEYSVVLNDQSEYKFKIVKGELSLVAYDKPLDAVEAENQIMELIRKSDMIWP